MAFTQQDVDAIDRAIASGELTVRLGEKLITYRSMAELREARAIIKNELSQAAGGVTSTCSFAEFGRG